MSRSSLVPSVSLPAIVLAGDRRAAKAVYGESKVYLEIAGKPLVAHVVEVLQAVPEVSEVWVVGDAERLGALFDEPAQRSRIQKPLHIVEQLRSLYENGWQTYRRLLPAAGPHGRDPEEADLDLRVLYLSGDLPFATPQEISTFVRRAVASGRSYVLGLVTSDSLTSFQPGTPGGPGIEPEFFHLKEGRFRQSNLHLLKPARILNRFYVEEMYEHRYQREWGNIAALAWRLLTSEQGGLVVMAYYALMHLALMANRLGLGRLADRIRSWVPSHRIERGCSELLRAEFCFEFTEAGGCAVDIDNEAEYDAARERYAEWHAAQAKRAVDLYGPIPLGAESSAQPGANESSASKRASEEG